jgi:hypothetical protein
MLEAELAALCFRASFSLEKTSDIHTMIIQPCAFGRHFLED